MHNNNEKTIEKLYESAKNKKLSHAVLIECSDAQKSLSVALTLAKLVLCRSNCGDNSEGVCRSCSKINKNVHPDVILIDVEPSKSSIGVDAIRNLLGSVYITPTESQNKIYIINKSDSLTLQAQNAFLKLLEEPPKGVIFLLLCDSLTSLLETIRSRTQIFSLNSTKKTSDLELNMLEISKAIASKKDYEIMKSLVKYSNERAIFTQILEELMNLFVNSHKKTFFVGDYLLALQIISDSFSQKKIINIIDNLKNILMLTKRNVNLNLLFCELCTILILGENNL